MADGSAGRYRPGNDCHAPGYDAVRPVRELVTDTEAGEALHFLATSAHKIAELQSDRDYFEYMIAAAEAVGALYSTETAVDKRKWEARTSANYLNQMKQWRESAREFLALKAKREAAALKVDVWRTIQANKRGEPAWPGSNSQPARSTSAPSRRW
jgi:hypothetical protein